MLFVRGEKYPAAGELADWLESEGGNPEQFLMSFIQNDVRLPGRRAAVIIIREGSILWEGGGV